MITVWQEQTYLNVTEDNKQIIYNAFNNYAKNIDEVSRVSVGSGFHSGELHLYYKNGEQETLYRIANIDEISKYIKENGYNYDKILMILIGISVIVIFSIFIYAIYRYCKFIKKFITRNC